MDIETPKVWLPYVLLELDAHPLDLDDADPDLTLLGICSTPEKAKDMLKPFNANIMWHDINDFHDEWEQEGEPDRYYIEADLPVGGLRIGKLNDATIYYAAIISVDLDSQFTGEPLVLVKTAWIAALVGHKDEILGEE